MIDALTCQEKHDAVTAAINLLQTIDNMEGNAVLVKALHSFLRQMFKEEKEHYSIHDTESSLGILYDIAAYCKVYKEIAGYRYYSDGSMQTGYWNKLWLEPWKPRDEKVLAKVAEKNKKFRWQYEHQQEEKDDNRITAKELAQRDIEQEVKEFERTLNSLQNMFLRYQLNKYLDKKQRPSKKFICGGKTAVELVRIFKATARTNRDIKCLQPFVDKIHKRLRNLCQCNGYYRITINSFETVENVAEAYKQKSLIEEQGTNFNIPNKRFYERKEFRVEDDPDIREWTGINLSYNTQHFLCLMYSLQQAVNKKEMDNDLMVFLKELGLITLPEEDETDGTKHL